VGVMYGFADPELTMELARQRMKELQGSARRVGVRRAEADIVHAVFADEEPVTLRSDKWSRMADGQIEGHQAAS